MLNGDLNGSKKDALGAMSKYGARVGLWRLELEPGLPAWIDYRIGRLDSLIGCKGLFQV